MDLSIKLIMSENIKAFVRVRPGQNCVLNLEANKITLNESSFVFDKVFGPNCKTKEVYKTVAKPLVDACVSGFNGTLVAYGQTGTGKTNTLFAPIDGLVARSLDRLFKLLVECESKVHFSFIQVYQEKMYDVMNEHKEPVNEHFVRKILVTTPMEVKNLIELGQTRLYFAETNMNRHSSRSHAICFLQIESKKQKDLFVHKSTLTLCDLAGSERVKKSMVSGTLLREACDINLSLLELGNVIQALAERKKHVPFRNSLLTRTLQNSISGNCLTSLIVCVSGLKQDSYETKTSLMFGSRAMRITNCAQVNLEVDYEKLSASLAKELKFKEQEWKKREQQLLKFDISASLKLWRQVSEVQNGNRKTLKIEKATEQQVLDASDPIEALTILHRMQAESNYRAIKKKCCIQ